MRIFLLLTFVFISFKGFSQDDSALDTKSVILTYTPSKLLHKDQWDIKWFNNLYTETEDLFGPNGSKRIKPRETFFTSTIDVFTGVSENSSINIGLLLEFRSNVIAGRKALASLSFGNDGITERSGFTSFAPAIKFNPLKGISNFTIQTAFHIPLVKEESNQNSIFLDQKGFIFQNRFFYDHTFLSGDWQIFTELNTEFSFGDKKESFANNSLNILPGVFLSYFPSNKFTVLVLAQHSQRFDLGNDFTQNFTAIGSGAKYQLTKILNIEMLYTDFIRGNNTGLGETFNIGLRALF